jgi:hypothetical protein
LNVHRRLVGGKPFAVRLCGKMTRGMRSLEYFTTHQVTGERRGRREEGIGREGCGLTWTGSGPGAAATPRVSVIGWTHATGDAVPWV